MDCKFLNFWVNIAKSLKLHGLKMNFSLIELPLKKPKKYNNNAVGALNQSLVVQHVEK
jgi:hypothetical protein